MSSKKIWAASLAAVIAGSTFAVVASAAEDVDPGATGKAQVKVDGTTIDAKIVKNASVSEKLEADGQTLKITPAVKCYSADDTKVDIEVKLSNPKFDGYTIVGGDLKGKVEGENVTLKITDFDLKATVKSSKTYKLNIQSTDADKDELTLEFKITNAGTFTEPDISYTKGDYVTKIDTKIEKDYVVVVYDPSKIAKQSDYANMKITATGSGEINGTKITTNQEIKYGSLKLNGNGYTQEDVVVEYNAPNAADGSEPMFTKKIKLHFMNEEDYANFDGDPVESDESDSSDTSTEESKPTVSTVEIGDDGVLEGADVTKAVFVEALANKTWNDVKTVTFKSEVPFSLGFAVKAGAVKDKADATWYQKGVDELAKEDLPESAFATEWTLTEEEVAAMIEGSETDTLKLTTKDGKAATITANVTVKETAPNTGIALAIAPAALATAFVTVAAVMSKKKKG